MANASDFLIGANDEHGLNPPTLGKRSPILPYINRSFYENEFNKEAKNYFIEACLRTGFRVYDVKPEINDISIPTRIDRIRRQNLTLLVTFAYNASGSGLTFNSGQGFEIFYSTRNPNPTRSRQLSENIYNRIVQNTDRKGRGVNTLNVSVLSSVNCPSTLIEAGFMTNFFEAKLMLDPDYALAIGESACQGVCDFLGVTFVTRDNLANYSTLRTGSEGNQVVLLQYLLNSYGYDLVADGDFGNKTFSAVTNFQNNNNLTADGIVGKNTWSVLLNLNPTSKVLRQGDRSSGVLYLQRKLLSKLYPITSLDGVFGPETQRAVVAFQTENGLTPDGIVGRNTWSKVSQIGSGRT